MKGQIKRNYFYIVIPLSEVRKNILQNKKPVEIKLYKNGMKTCFVTLLNIDYKKNKMKRAKIHINRYVRKILGLEIGDMLEIEIENPKFIKNRPSKIFSNEKIDFLATIPKDINVVEEGDFLILWRRPRSRSISIKRYVDVELSAKFFGLLFSEGQKCTNTTGAYVSISTKDIELQKTVATFLREFLENEKLITAYCLYDLKIDNSTLETILKNYKNIVGINPNPVKAEMGGNFFFAINCNSTLVGETLLNSLNFITKLLISENFDEELKIFAKTFISFEIMGDGCLCVSDSGVSLQIADENVDRRYAIKTILDKLGLKSNDDGKLIVYSDVTGLDKRFYMLDLGILYGKNLIKLVNSINNLKFFNLQMQRLSVLLKFDEFDNRTVCKIFNWSTNKTTKWLLAMIDKELIQRKRKLGYSTFYKVLDSNILNQYLQWRIEYKNY